jgi:hypothetical protein
MQFGVSKDTNLYRNGNDSLKTDDDFEAVGDMHGEQDEKCVRIDTDLTTGLQLETVWHTMRAVTVEAIWCETDAGTVGLDFAIDDGAPEGVNGSDVLCDSDGEDDGALAGDWTMGIDDRMDLDIGTVTTAVRVTACFRYRVD